MNREAALAEAHNYYVNGEEDALEVAGADKWREYNFTVEEVANGKEAPPRPPLRSVPSPKENMPQPHSQHADTPAPTGQRRVRLIPGTEVKTAKVEWLVDSWIPKNALTLIAGREGLGKSTIACKIAADATTGDLTGTPMKVAYLNTEDSRTFTVKPRLQAAGAVEGRYFFFDVVTEVDLPGSLNLPRDTGILADALVAEGVSLVILDAAKSAMDPRLDGYRDDDVRQFLEPLVAMCDRHNITIVGLAHFGKKESNDPGKLILGSVAWSQIARSVLSVAVDKSGSLVVTNTKGNLAPKQVSREATIRSVDVPTDDGQVANVGALVWGELTDVSAADLLQAHDGFEEAERTEAERWLLHYLRGSGPTPRSEVLKAAQKERVGSESTVKRAFRNIGGVSELAGFPSVATWSLPPHLRGTRGTHEPADPTGQLGHSWTTPNDPTVKPGMTSGNTTQKGPVTPVGSRFSHARGSSDPTDPGALVLDVLSPEIPMSPRILRGSFTADQLEAIGDLDGVLGSLTRQGHVAEKDGKYLRA